jgi:hypothetical protein
LSLSMPTGGRVAGFDGAFGKYGVAPHPDRTGTRSRN